MMTSPARVLRTRRLAASAALGSALLLALGSAQAQRASRIEVLNHRTPSGVLQTAYLNGLDDRPNNPFFLSLGANGRTCASCHEPANGWSLSAQSARKIFRETGGFDPLFDPVDGTNAPHLDRSTLEARRSASSLLLGRGLIRMRLQVPAGAEFEAEIVEDPYGNDLSEGLSLFRRPSPVTNLLFQPALMWDGRASEGQPMGPELGAEENVRRLVENLKLQAEDANRAHSAAPLPLPQFIRTQMAEFQRDLLNGQLFDWNAGLLNADGARGGPVALAFSPFAIGMNDPLATGFNPETMRLFRHWRASADPAKRSVARGETVFNTKTFRIRGVAGFPDGTATCSTCHNAPNRGSHTLARFLNTGTGSESRNPGLPVYTLRHLLTGERLRTTDPGRAMSTGKWEDVGRFRVPGLRGLASRAPYFHNGSAESLEAVIAFYEARFELALTEKERADLAAFLRCL